MLFKSSAQTYTYNCNVIFPLNKEKMKLNEPKRLEFVNQYMIHIIKIIPQCRDQMKFNQIL